MGLNLGSTPHWRRWAAPARPKPWRSRTSEAAGTPHLQLTSDVMMSGCVGRIERARHGRIQQLLGGTMALSFMELLQHRRTSHEAGLRSLARLCILL